MGLLDDAIREHLELKRRGGADPAEVERLEQEALSEAEAPDGGHTPAPAPAADAVEERAVAAEPAAEPEPVAEPEKRAPAEPEARPEPAADADQPTRQFTLEELEEAERREDEGEHDELEDTPDFLQETPEHDRLWFEQKPPKDFDF